MSTSVLLVGSGGYAATYVNSLLDYGEQLDMKLVGVVDPYASASYCYDRFKDLVPVYSHMDEFYAQHSADLAIVSTPIHLHFDQCMTALDNGSHVLCEKPLVPTVKQLDRLAAKAESVGKTLSVGFQWCYSPVMRGLKERILANEFGKPQNFKTYVPWPRDWAYYARSSWAGKYKTADGKPIYDSVASNATAHYVQNLLFLLGPNMEESAPLQNLQHECYKANDIETFDTIVFKAQAGGADIFYAASHAVNYKLNPVMDCSFENARILANFFNQDWTITIHHSDGRIEELAQEGDSNMTKMEYVSKSIKGLLPPACTTETVRPFTALMDAVFSNLEVCKFEESLVVRDTEAKCTYVKNLHLDLWECFVHGKLLSE